MENNYQAKKHDDRSRFRKIYDTYKHHVFAMLFIFGFIGFFTVLPLQQLDFIDPISEALGDFEITDIVFANDTSFREDRTGDPAILLVNTGKVNEGDDFRSRLAHQIRIIDKWNPKVIGIDHFFRKLKYKESDTALANAIAEAKAPVVFVTKAAKFNENSNEFDSLETSHPYFTQNVLEACANLTTDVGNQYGDDAYKTCRSFMPSFEVNNKEELAFSVKLAQIYNPELAKAFLERNNSDEDISFRRTIGSYGALSVDQVLADTGVGGFVPDMVEGKIVIMGTLSNFYDIYDTEDMFFTPLNKRFAGKSHVDMNGAVIHANIISMILAKDYINHVPNWIAYSLAVLVLFLNIVLFRRIMDGRYGNWYDALSKVIQISETIIIFGILVYLFRNYKLKIDLTLMLGSIALVGDLLEIYQDVVKRFGETLWNRFSHLFDRFNTKKQLQ